MKPVAVIIENDDSYRMFLRFQMKTYGFEVIEAINGSTGLKMISLHTPTIIISDFDMPSGNGGEVWEALQKDPQLRRIPFVILSALVDGHWGHHQNNGLFALEAESHREGSKLRLMPKGRPTKELSDLLHSLLGFLPIDGVRGNDNVPVDAMRRGSVAGFDSAHRALAYV